MGRALYLVSPRHHINQIWHTCHSSTQDVDKDQESKPSSDTYLSAIKELREGGKKKKEGKSKNRSSSQTTALVGRGREEAGRLSQERDCKDY